MIEGVSMSDERIKVEAVKVLNDIKDKLKKEIEKTKEIIYI